jgi:hypothetical protein
MLPPSVQPNQDRLPHNSGYKSTPMDVSWANDQETEDNTRVEQGLMANPQFMSIVEYYLQMENPNLQPLIEIEKKYWTSNTNKHYRMPRRFQLDDSEDSIRSLEGVTLYDLESQNILRSKRSSQQIQLKQRSYNESCNGSQRSKYDSKNKQDILVSDLQAPKKYQQAPINKSSRSHDAKKRKEDTSQDNFSQVSRPRMPSDEKKRYSKDPGYNMIASFRPKDKSYSKLELKNSSKLGGKNTISAKVLHYPYSKQLQKKNGAQTSRPQSPPRARGDSNKELPHKPSLKGVDVIRVPRKREKIIKVHDFTEKKGKHSYLRLEAKGSNKINDSSGLDAEIGKVFLKKFHPLFGRVKQAAKPSNINHNNAKHFGTMREQHNELKRDESKAKHLNTFTLDHSSSKSTAQKHLQYNYSKVPLQLQNSRELLSKLSKGFLNSQRQIIAGSKGRGSDSAGRTPSRTNYGVHNTTVNPNILSTPKNHKKSASKNKLNAIPSLKSKINSAHKQVQPVKPINQLDEPKRRSTRQRRRNNTPSNSKSPRYQTHIGIFGPSTIATERNSNFFLAKPSSIKKNSSKGTEKRKLGEVENQFFASAFKQKVLQKLFNRAKP